MYAIVDIETTGGSSKSGKITEIAILVFDGEEIIDSFVSLINPECSIPSFITNITGITNEMVAQSPKFYEVAKRIVEITSNRVFVAHNASFDYNFIKKEFQELGFEFKLKKLCTVQLSRKYLPGHKSYSLGSLCNDLGIKINGRHRAEGDALATVKVFERIMKKHIEKSNTLKLF
jgi:DNA polymerase-3 subunit epsilon